MTHWRNMQIVSPLIHKDNANFMLQDLGFRDAAEVQALYKSSPILHNSGELPKPIDVSKVKRAYRILREGKTLKTVGGSGIL